MKGPSSTWASIRARKKRLVSLITLTATATAKAKATAKETAPSSSISSNSNRLQNVRAPKWLLSNKNLFENQ